MTPGTSSRAPGVFGCLCSRSKATDDRGAGEEQVDVKAPAPGQVRGQRAAEQQPDRAAAGRDRPVDAERLAAFLRVGEGRGEQRQRGRREDGAENALAGAGGDQHREVDRRAADGGGHGEAREAGDEHDLAADQVGEPAAEQQQAAERQRVRRHDPLPVHVAEAQVALRRRQRDVHDRGVKHHHQLRDRDDDQDQPAARVRLGGRRVPARAASRCSPPLARGRLPRTLQPPIWRVLFRLQEEHNTKRRNHLRSG